jgi:ribosome-binding protein aMBF1 (putative translation factor)
VLWTVKELGVTAIADLLNERGVPCPTATNPRLNATRRWEGAGVPAPDQPVDTALAAILRRLREERGLSQEATAQAAGISLNTYSRIELAQASPTWPTRASHRQRPSA